MIYVTFDHLGALTGCYRQELHPAHEAAHLEIADDLAKNWPAYRMTSDRKGLEVKPHTDPVKTDVEHDAEIDAELSALDLASIRPLRENDKAALAVLEAKAVALRAKLKKPKA